MDDSQSDAARLEYLRALKELECADQVRYSGIKEKVSYVQQLSGHGIDPEIARFAVLGDFGAKYCTTGANRNCILLDTVGELVLVADDDTVCKTAPHPEREDCISFGGHQNPREVWFYGTREELSAAAKWEPCDLLGEHERILGKKLVDIMSHTPKNQLRLGKACNHLIDSFESGDARVTATMTGMAGDSGAGGAQRFLLSSRSVLDRLAESDAASRRAFASREVLWVARSHTITHSPQCQGAGLGLANDDLLPPFFPIGRNQDGVFGVLNLLTFNAFVGHIPVAVFHNTAAGRKYERFPPFRIANLILSLVWLTPPQNVSLRTALCSLGNNLLEIGNLPEQEFRDFLASTVSRSETKILRMVDLNRSKMTNCPPYLEKEIEDYRAYVLAHLADRDCFIPDEFLQFPPEQAREKTRQLVCKAGQLFLVWPDMVEASRHLKEKGVRLSARVQDLPIA
jgi:hypothetical protein